MKMVCLDLEGVLIPEIWKAVAAETGIDGFNRTTRDEPDYDVLMRYRLGLLAEHDIRLPQIQEVIGRLTPLEGAQEFTQWLLSQTRLVILSDTFEQFAWPLMQQLGFPTLFCHELVIDAEGRITGYQLRQQNQKERAVRAFQSLNFTVYAAGDSYNDLTMLRSADAAALFRPTDQFATENSDLPVCRSHDDLKGILTQLLAE